MSTRHEQYKVSRGVKDCFLFPRQCINYVSYIELTEISRNKLKRFWGKNPLVFINKYYLKFQSRRDLLEATDKKLSKFHTNNNQTAHIVTT